MLKSAELKQELETLKASAKGLTVAGEIMAKVEEIKALKAKIELAEMEEADEQAEIEAKTITSKKLNNETANRGLILAKAIAGKELTDEEKVTFNEIKAVMVEGDKTKGGVVITPDISTMIKEFQDATRNFDIRPYLNVEPVGTMKGSRPIADNVPEASGFASLDEGAEIQALYEPTFTDLEYNVRKYAGYIPLTNELLEDSAENILAFIIKWMGENELNTYAYQVFNGTGTKSAQGILTEAKTGGELESRTETIDSPPDIKKFKTIFNVDLESVSNVNLAIYTNADGYNYLDGLEDENGKPYLQPDVTAKSGFTFLGREIVKVPKKFIANVTTGEGESAVTRTPFVIGSLKELYTMFDRKAMSVESSNIGGDAWRKDTTEVKGIFRFDGKLVNKNAIKVLYAKLS
ncbi:phage major capsid protein [Ruminiclostridium josui]|uniref:phage major capsid protein n=1 Tax=Ruminiclostridium josui TaxID=1499 RepID=UPI0004677CBD|nr:phage major capsid protein [Ruminiclostridium josui]